MVGYYGGRLPTAPILGFPKPRSRSSGHWFSHHPIAVCLRVGGIVRYWPGSVSYTHLAAAAALVSHVSAYSCPPEKAVIRVADTGQALLTLGAWYRQRFAVRTVAITGSTGKTTAKDLTAEVLGCRFRTLKNPGNLNTEVGLPLTLFKLEAHHEVAVLELAMRGPGQIRQLAQVAEPEVGVITNTGVAHIELLGSQENIARAKGELLECLPAHGLAVLNGDDPGVRQQAVRSRCPVVYFGLEPGACLLYTSRCV